MTICDFSDNVPNVPAEQIQKPGLGAKLNKDVSNQKYKDFSCWVFAYFQSGMGHLGIFLLSLWIWDETDKANFSEEALTFISL